jgi:hypothetical protein
MLLGNFEVDDSVGTTMLNSSEVSLIPTSELYNYTLLAI